MTSYFFFSFGLMVALESSDFTDLEDDEARGPRSSLFYYCPQ